MNVCDRVLVVTHDDRVWLAIGRDRDARPRDLLGLDVDEARQLATALGEAAESCELRPPRRRAPT